MLSWELLLTGDAQITKLNARHRGRRQPTDVLSFEGAGRHHLGSVVINLEQLARQAREYGHSSQREGAFLLVHGLLHLCGYDHQTTAEAAEMFGLQTQILEALGHRRS